MKKSRGFCCFLSVIFYLFTFLPFITSILLLDDLFASFQNIRLDIGDALLRTTVSATGGNIDRVVVNMIHGDIIHHDISFYL